MPIEASDITPAALDAFNASLRVSGHDNIELYGLSAALRDALNHPDIRQAVLDAVGREHEAMMAALPAWGDMSDLDKGAALMFLAKLENEGYEYAVENYPATYIEDPRLTALGPEDACAHAARFEDVAEDMDGDEHERLYDLALDHDRGAR